MLSKFSIFVLSALVGILVVVLDFIIVESLVARILGVVFGAFASYIVFLINSSTADSESVNSFKVFNLSKFEILPVFVMGLSFLAMYFIPSQPSELFSSPLTISLSNWIQHVSSVLLTSFLPGYFILRIIDWRKCICGLSVILVSFLLSIFSVFLVGYSTIILGGSIRSTAFVSIIALNVVLLGVWVFVSVLNFVRSRKTTFFEFKFFKINSSSLVFVGCILLVVFIGTYGLYGAHLIQDQRVHHGWALLYQDFLPVVDGTIDSPTPLVYPIYLATLFSLTNIPTANALSSLNMLNALPLIGFYVLVREYFGQKKGLAEIATFFGFLTGGVGWVFAKINLLGVSGGDVAGVINDSWVKTYDILTSDSFLFAGHPDITTPLITIALPSMFMLVYFVSPKLKISNSLKYFLMFSILTLSLFSHPETLIIVLTLAMFFVFKPDFKGSFVLLGSLLCLICLDLVAPAQYYSLITVSVLGNQISLFLVAVVGVVGTIGLQFLRLNLFSVIKVPKINPDSYKKFAFQLTVLVIYGYLFSYIVYSIIVNDFSVWSVFGVDGSIPWYFYPMRLGVIGLLAIPAMVYTALYWRIQRSSVVFIIWIFVILALGSFYKEYRMIKHLHVILSIFAASSFVTLIPKISFKTNLQKILTILVTVSVIVVAIGSPLLYVEYMQTKEKDYGVLPGSVAPSAEEYEALSWLKQRLDRENETVITLPRGANNFLSKLVQYSGAWIVRTNMFYRFFELTDVDSFVTLAQKTNLKYVYITANDKQTLETNPAYTNSYIKHLITVISPVFSNEGVEIYEIPKMASSTESKIAIVLPINLFSSNLVPDAAKQYYSNIIEILALSGIDYSLITNYDLTLNNYETVILPYTFNNKNLEPYLSWAAQGNQLIILEPAASNALTENDLTWKLLKGDWAFTNGTYLQSDLEKSSGIITEQTFSNYSISASVRAIKSSSLDNHLGLLINYKNDSNWDYVFLRNNQLILFALQNGTGKEVWSTPSTLLYNTSYSIRLDVQDFSIHFYLNDVLLGTYTKTNTTNNGNIGYRTFNAIGEFQDLSVEPLNTSTPDTEPFFIHENYRLGKIVHSTFPLQYLLNDYNKNDTISNSIFSAIIELLQGSEESTFSISNDLAHINYAKGTITANNSTMFSSSLVMPTSVMLHGTVEIFDYEQQNGTPDLTLVDKFDDVELTSLQTFGSTFWTLKIQNQSIITPGELKHFYVEPENPFTLELELDTNSTLSFAVNNTVLHVSNKYVVINVNEMSWVSTENSLKPYFLVKTPHFSSVEEITFESAYLSKGIKDVFVKEEAVSLTGAISLKLQLADNDITVISDLLFDAIINILN